MFKFLTKWFSRSNKNGENDHRGRPLQKGEKSISARLEHTASSKHSAIRRAPIDMAQGD